MTSTFRRVLGRVFAFHADVRGVVAVEHALAAPFLLLLLSGLIDLGYALQQSSSLSTAARAGAQYAMRFPSDSDGITQVVRKAVTYDPDTLTINATLACECSDGTSVTCTDKCAGAAPKAYVSITISKAYSSPLPTAMILGITTVSGSAVMRAN